VSARKRRPALWPGILAGLVLLAVLAGGPIYSLARTHDLASDQDDYALKAVNLPDGSQVEARWNPCQQAITYAVNLSGLPGSARAGVLAEVEAGVARVSRADGMHYRYVGATTFVPQQATLAQGPAEIVVAAVDRRATDLDLAESSLGFGGVLWATWTANGREGAAVVRGYVVLMPAAMTKLTRGFRAGKSQGNVILHEFGHATGLEHVTAGDQVMNPDLTPNSRAGFGSGDLAGLRKVGRTAGCLSVPASVGIRDLN
jgi:hypothetical protein